MKNTFLKVAVGLFVVSIALVLIMDQAMARHHGRYYKHSAKRPPAVVVIPPPSAGPSDWCKKHPKKCVKAKATEPKITNMCEHCMDNKGNRDGFVSGWEHENFAPECMQLYDN